MKNVEAPGEVLAKAAVKKEIARAEKTLKGSGRLVIRKSGTEPLIRVMAEGDNEKMVQKLVGDIASVIRKAAA